MSGTDRTRRFEAAVLPHLDAAYNLARWLLRDEQSAQDVVQEAYLRAFRFFDGFRGDQDARPWLLSIVRNSCFTWLRERGREPVEFDEERDSEQRDPALYEATDGPERLLERKLERAQVNAAVATLTPLFREVLILRELEAMSYDEIAQVVGIPVGTVMSRLSRARSMLRTALAAADKED
ncbi:MAG: sigma-70 family RNA polymerase sigma factor [Gammaproteobacteria bacterium]|jgi:RNA polymerase sigma-70 factor (ECF subfamily)|nr:sigma-70 family RNA polymerase sigma factor [Gammaproteobacteria bacterium]MBU1409111.1 sigma-70 family RNA polymerase sigma factor [Gammaproteobacteria bacterium]MBU1531007.1 sigma-70 family RNA polymerase sigma factor [Gammaproteobacteria bacterium]